jgi:hypothetical protein
VTGAEAAAALAVLVVLVGCEMLVLAGIQGWTHPDRLRATLIGHRLWPTAMLRRAVVQAYERAIAVVGSVGVVLVLAGQTSLPAFVVSLLYAGFTVYLGVLWARRGRVDCGCLGDGGSTGPAALLRSTLVVVGGVWCLVAGPALDPGQRILLALIASVLTAFVVVADSWPRSRGPGSSRAPQRRR